MDNFKNKWDEYKSKVKSKWNKLTSEDLSQINGKRELLLGKLQTRYGWQQKQAEEEVKRFESSLEGEKGQKISAEYERDEEETSERGSREVKESDVEGKNSKTEKFDKEHFRGSESEEGKENTDENQDFPKRKVR